MLPVFFFFFFFVVFLFFFSGHKCEGHEDTECVCVLEGYYMAFLCQDCVPVGLEMLSYISYQPNLSLFLYFLALPSLFSLYNLQLEQVTLATIDLL